MRRFALAALLALLARPALSQAPRITPGGDPSVRNDTIYKLSVNPADYADDDYVYLLDDGVLRFEADGRTLSRERAHINLWLKDVAPSTELRKWFNHDPQKFPEFRRRYETELKSEAAQQALTKLREIAKQGQLTLVFAAHDANHSNAAILQDLLLHSS